MHNNMTANEQNLIVIELGLGQMYWVRSDTHRYLKRLMSFPYLPY